MRLLPSTMGAYISMQYMIKSFLLSVLREISEETSQLVLKFKNPIGKSTNYNSFSNIY